MDISRYSFTCQKAFHQGLQYARSYGHKQLEIEHIILAILKSEESPLQTDKASRLKFSLEEALSKKPRLFGDIEIDFGIRLDKALDSLESLFPNTIIEERDLWEELIKNSPQIETFLKPSEEDKSRQSKIDKKITEKSEKAEKTKKEAFKIPSEELKTLEKYTIDLSAQAERGELDPVIGRDSETRRVLEILGRKRKNNPILIGEAGVGKTAIAECLALKIAEGQVPEKMRKKRILSLDLGSLVAGAKLRGEFEERVKKLLKAIKSCQGEIILFIDEIHMLAGAGSAEGSADAANLLKPALARGELHCLGATTLVEYRQYIEKDAALERRFQPIKVSEPSRSASLSILRGIKNHYEIYHAVQIDDEALINAVDLSIRFLPSRRLPDKAIDIIDEACSRLRLQIDSTPTIMSELRSKITQLEIEKKSLEGNKDNQKALTKINVDLSNASKNYSETEKIWRSHQEGLSNLKKYEAKKQELHTLFDNSKTEGKFEFAAKLQYVELPKVSESIKSFKKELLDLQKKHTWLRQIVGSIEIKEVISSWTKIPIENILHANAHSFLKLEERLASKIFGQTKAVNTISKAIRRSKVGLNDPKRPIGAFLFIGPSGVGKTELVKVLSTEIFGDEKKLVRIDMSEFMESHSVSRLIGSPPGYVGFGEGGELSEAIRQNPHSAILLDEIEKAHPKILDILLQIFDDGRLSDGQGRLINFKNTMIVMTSNIVIPSELTNDDLVRTFLAERHMRPEFVGRIDEIILFHPLGSQHFRKLLLKQLEQLNERLQERQTVIHLGKRLEQKIMLEAHQGSSGGRAMRRSFERLVTDKVSDHILTNLSLSGVWRLEIDSQGRYIWRNDFSLDRYLMPPAS